MSFRKENRLALVVVACAAIPFESGNASARPSGHVPDGIFLEAPEGRAPIPPGFTPRTIYSNGLNYTKSAEGWRSGTYNDVAGYCTIGYGHLIKKSRCDGTEPPEFVRGLSLAQGTQLLIADMRPAQYEVEKDVKEDVTKTLTDGEYAALCDFTFNVGTANFRTSMILTYVNEGLMSQVPRQLLRWVNAGNLKNVKGLVNRRDQEIALLLDGKSKAFVASTRAPAPPGAPTSPVDIRKGETP
jgi:lysozyme